MMEKRKLPPRERRESAKRRASEATSLPTPTKPAPTKKKASSPPPRRPSTPRVFEEGLPTRLKDGRPLPTLREPQPGNLSLKEYQSIAESGVLASSLQRSRSKWLADGIFERYWTKPSKKKGPQELQNPPKDTMTKLGTCTIIIEPHNFEATLYTVREPQAIPQIQYGPPRPYMQHGSPNNFHQYHPPPNPPPYPQSRQLPIPPPMSNSRDQKPPNPPPGPPSSNIAVVIPRNAPPSIAGLPEGGPPPSKPSPDPVIQMLATRAATDPELKALMRVVASSKATQPQLRTFQSHIDELNALLATQNAKKEQNLNLPSNSNGSLPARATPPAALYPPNPPQSSGPSPTSTARSTPVPPAPPAVATAAAPPRSSPSPYPPYQPPPSSSLGPPPPIRSKPPLLPPPNPYQYGPQPPMPRPDPTAIVFEFASSATSTSERATGSSDRFLFPPYSILEYQHPTAHSATVVASFLVVRKGSVAGEGSGYDQKIDYWQPVTMKICAANMRTLEPLARVVKSPGEVVKYMEETMKKKKSAGVSFLALRLPREKEGLDGEVGGENGRFKVDVEEAVDDDEELRDTYEGVTSVVPLGGRPKG